MYDLSKERPGVRMRIRHAGLPAKSIGMEFSDIDDSPEKTQVMQWVGLVKAGKVIRALGEPTCGLGLLLAGKPGHGKTTMASIALQSLIRTITPDLFGSDGSMPANLAGFRDYPKLLRLQKMQFEDPNENTQREIDSIFGDLAPYENYQTFVLDDLGKEYRTATGWAENQFDALLRSRFNAGLPTIVTTNTALKDWGTVYGEAMGSFAHEAFIPLVVRSQKGDHRKNEKENE